MINTARIIYIHLYVFIYLWISYSTLYRALKHWFKTTMLYYTLFSCLGSTVLGNKTINLQSDALNLAVCIKNSCVMQHIFILMIGNSIIIFCHLTQHWRMSLKHFNACVFYFWWNHIYMKFSHKTIVHMLGCIMIIIVVRSFSDSDMLYGFPFRRRTSWCITYAAILLFFETWSIWCY